MILAKIWKIFFKRNKWLLNRVEIIVAKGEIAHDEQFLLLPQCFQRSLAAEVGSENCFLERDK